jgi:hypothetical protein
MMVIKVITSFNPKCHLILEEYDFWVQFHEQSTSSFYIRKFRVQLFCAYVLGLYFTGARLHVEH